MDNKFKRNGLAKKCPECKHRLTDLDYMKIFMTFWATEKIICPHCKKDLDEVRKLEV